jgi:regulation of enolase protein 1 (concanavalin A-like superfamily)
LDKNRITYDNGKYDSEIGASSKDIKGTVSATMNGKFTPVLKTVVADCGLVVMQKGSSAQTSVTAALTDDSFFDITKAKVVYSSNNPDVVSIDSKGLVTATGTGVATLTAFVTVNDVTKSGSFAIKVTPDMKPASLTMNGKNINGFNPEVHSYSYLMQESSKVPQVNATSTSSGVVVNVEQAKKIPGSAVITLIDKVTLEKNSYVINFGTKSIDDEFNSAAIGKQWTWVRENSANWSLTKENGSITITSKTGDLREATNNAENILLQSANTDWVVESKLKFSTKPSGFSQSGGLIAYQDDDNYVKLSYGAGAGGRRGGRPGSQGGSLSLITEENGSQKNAANVSIADIIKDNNTLYFKLERKGDVYTAYYSLDGKKYELVGTANLTLKDTKAGVLVCEGVADPRMARFMQNQPQQPNATQKPFEVSVDYFHIKNSGLK